MNNLAKLRALVIKELSTHLCEAERPYDFCTLTKIDGKIESLQWVLIRIDELIERGSNE